jgi:hypothetical protein
MGFLDRFKGKGGLKDKAVDLAKEHDDKIDQGIDKASDLADRATKGKYTDKIDGAAQKAKDAYEKPEGQPPSPTPPPTPPAADTPPTPSAPQPPQAPPATPQDPQP